ncbi:hypothetical protein GCM10009854_22690 [Saccharopolyspora halophila]|uniref:Uncharacterized protein n=1 Tax=Saccharopolyspora halophila TaxID=405551 RepID=A0ABP5T4B8_9PSEU
MSSKWDSVDPRGRAREGLRTLFFFVPLLILAGAVYVNYPSAAPVIVILFVGFVGYKVMTASKRSGR